VSFLGYEVILGSVPLILDWNDGGKKVAVTGTFTGWRKRVNLRKTYLPVSEGDSW
jgi:hypothetical protein